MDVSLSELRELVMDREAWRAAIHGVAKSRTQLSNWTELIYENRRPAGKPKTGEKSDVDLDLTVESQEKPEMVKKQNV